MLALSSAPLLALLPLLPHVLATPSADRPSQDKRFLPFHYPTPDQVQSQAQENQQDKRDPTYLPFHVPLHHTDANKRQHHPDLEVRQDWLAGQARGLRKKYEKHLDERELEIVRRDEIMREAEMRKRATGTVQMTNVGIDASYAGQVGVGTPAQNFLLILDTGSSDMWVADQDCTTNTCSSLSRFDTRDSSTYDASSTPFQISYGSGDAAGLIVQDTVTMGGFTVQNQGFGKSPSPFLGCRRRKKLTAILAIVNQTTAGLVTSPISGLMGLGWESIAQTGATPFWESLAQSGTWTTQEMGVFMARYRGDASATQVESEGGSLVLGGTDTSLYTGDINWIDIPSSQQDYWRIPLEGMSVQGENIDITDTRGSQPSTAIDTGTTLIAAPRAAISAIYGAIPGSAAMSGSQNQGLWQFPCDTNLNVSMQYGGLSYSISTADMNLGRFTTDTSMCTGAFFQMDMPSQSPISWIVGASFLKNVYSIYRYQPSAIGFAALSGQSNTVSNGTNTPTTGGGTIGPNGGSGSDENGNGNGGSDTDSGNGAGRASAVGAIGISLAALTSSLLAGLL